jgi:hypothetical protein
MTAVELQQFNMADIVFDAHKCNDGPGIIILASPQSV